MSSTLPSSRRQHILERVQQAGEAHIGALAQELSVSSITVRRDIASLAEEGLVEQVRGGARRAGPPPVPDGMTAHRPAAEHPRIAMVTPGLRYYWSTIIRGATEAAERLGADLSVHAYTASNEANTESNIRVVEQIAQAGDIDAVLLAPEMRGGAASERLVARIAELPMPVVLTERGIEGHGALGRMFDTVRSDHSMGAAQAVRHLAGLGHRRIGFAGDLSTPSNVHVDAGYRRAVELMGLDEVCDPGTVLAPSGPRLFEEIDALLAQFRERGVTAALVHSDTAATLVLQHAIRSGWSIPGDLSLVAYDDELSATARPALTAVAPAKHTLGVRAVELALHRIAHPQAAIEHLTLVPSLIVRETSRPPREAPARPQ